MTVNPVPDSVAPGVTGEPAPCACHQNLRIMLPNHGGHCCFRSASATCHAAEVADWEARFTAERGTPPTEWAEPHKAYGNFVG